MFLISFCQPSTSSFGLSRPTDEQTTEQINTIKTYSERHNNMQIALYANSFSTVVLPFPLYFLFFLSFRIHAKAPFLFNSRNFNWNWTNFLHPSRKMGAIHWIKDSLAMFSLLLLFGSSLSFPIFRLSFSSTSVWVEYYLKYCCKCNAKDAKVAGVEDAE